MSANQSLLDRPPPPQQSRQPLNNGDGEAVSSRIVPVIQVQNTSSPLIIPSTEESNLDENESSSEEEGVVEHMRVVGEPATETTDAEEGHYSTNTVSEQQGSTATAAAIRRRQRRHGRRRPRREHQIVQQQPQNQIPVAPAPLAHPLAGFVDDNDEGGFMAVNEGIVLKQVLDYESLPIARGSVALMICLWALLHFPSLPPYPLVSIFCGSFFCMLGGWAVYTMAAKPDLRLGVTSRFLETRIFQMISVSFICYIFDIMLDMARPMELFMFDVRDMAVFSKQVENARSLRPMDFIYNSKLWVQINTQFFLLSFSTLLLIYIPILFTSMAKKNIVMHKILMFELAACFYPVAYMVTPFLLMNILAATIPVEYQFTLVWVVMHIATLCWLVFILYGVCYYPELPILRPLGLPGYAYIETVTLAQLTTGVLFFEVFILLRTTYFHLVPDAVRESLKSPGFITGPYLYFEQLSQGIPQEKWNHSVPYPPTYEFLQGIFFVVSIIRHFKLARYIDEIHHRLELAENQAVDAVDEQEQD